MKLPGLLLYALLFSPLTTLAQWRYLTSIIPPTPYSGGLSTEVLGRTNEFVLATNEMARLVTFGRQNDATEEEAWLEFTKDAITFPARDDLGWALGLPPATGNSEFAEVVLVGPATVRMLTRSRSTGTGFRGTSGAFATWQISPILQSGRFVTLLVSPVADQGREFSVATNQIARLLSFPEVAAAAGILEVRKDGVTLPLAPRWWFGVRPPVKSGELIITGPATVSLKRRNDLGSFCTWEILPAESEPDNVVAAGAGKVRVNFEWSTNLVNWAVATNGVYGSPLEEKFFRIRADKAL